MLDMMRRLPALLVLLAAFAALGAAGSATPAGAGAVPQQQPTDEPREGPIPCDPSYTRTIEPQVVQEGEMVTVKTQYRFICTGETRKLNYIFVVENSAQLRQGMGGREALDNVTRGARNFINQVDYANGSRGGLMLYAGSRTWRQPLIGGEEGRKALIDAFNGISISPDGNSAGAGAAIRDSTGALPTGVSSDFSNVLIIVDAGAIEVPGAQLVDRYTACNAARISGVTVAVVSFPAAGRRLAACASSGWFFQLNSDVGRNAPETFDKIAEGLLRGLQMDKVIYSDFLEDGFRYEMGSGYPRPPDYVVLSEMFWEFVGRSVPPTGQLVEYKVRVDKDVFPFGVPRNLSLWSHIEFVYAQGTSIRVRLPNPPLCIYRDSPDECSGFGATATSPPPVETPTADPPDTPVPETPDPTDTPVPETPEPTDTPAAETPEPTDTPDSPSPGHGIFLPLTLRAGLAGG